MTRRIALLGDSIFDNGTYTGDDPDVRTHLAALVPEDWHVELLARDGASTETFAPQYDAIPDGTTDLVLSLGGNDGLLSADILAERPTSVSDALERLAVRLDAFEARYREVIDALRAHAATLHVCTIYDAPLDAAERTAARMALAGFNDVIIRVARDVRIDVLDLRAVCTDPSDHANPIEPSGPGGWKIASAILAMLEGPRDRARCALHVD